VLPLENTLRRSDKKIWEVMERNRELRIEILCESDNDLFFQSLSTTGPLVKYAVGFVRMREKKNRILRLKARVLKHCSRIEMKKSVDERIQIRQSNLRVNMNVIRVDNTIYACPVGVLIPSEKDYRKINDEDEWYHQIDKYLEFYHEEGAIYQSIQSDEMLETYDRDCIPRGSFPRKAFYNTDFQRYSVWCFVFTRSGKLLLHQRSMKVKDNRGLWDKSVGGHVDIKDSSTSISAERELIEELFMPNAEHTDKMREDTQDVVNLGKWCPEKRGYEDAFNDILEFDPGEWGYFFLPPTIMRTSKRRIHPSVANESDFELKETKFISDVFLFVAPEKFGVNDLKKLSKAAGQDHKLLTIQEIIEWVEREKKKETAEKTFTDDLLYIIDYLRDSLEEFAEMLRGKFSE